MANVAEMTVETEGGTLYAADSVKICRKDGEQGISFVCSGEMKFIPASEVAGIEVQEKTEGDRAGLCMTCMR